MDSKDSGQTENTGGCKGSSGCHRQKQHTTGDRQAETTEMMADTKDKMEMTGRNGRNHGRYDRHDRNDRQK